MSKLCEFDCKNDKRLDELEKEFKEYKNYCNEKFEKRNDIEKKFEKFIGTTENQIKTLEKSVVNLGTKIDKNLEAQRTNIYMFATTLIITFINVVIQFMMKN